MRLDLWRGATYLIAMTRSYRLFALSHLMLCLSFVLALTVVLGTVHCALGVPDAGPAVAAHHTPDSSGQMSHSGAMQHPSSAALCVAVCAGTNTVEGPDLVARHAHFALASWTIDAVPVWASYHPDPAQRPPDTTTNA